MGLPLLGAPTGDVRKAGIHAARCWAGAIHEFPPPIGATDSSFVRLLYFDTCRKRYAGISAIAVVEDLRHQQRQCAGSCPSKVPARKFSTHLRCPLSRNWRLTAYQSELRIFFLSSKKPVIDVSFIAPIPVLISAQRICKRFRRRNA
jgi:hypothetical protein